MVLVVVMVSSVSGVVLQYWTLYASDLSTEQQRAVQFLRPRIVYKSHRSLLLGHSGQVLGVIDHAVQTDKC